MSADSVNIEVAYATPDSQVVVSLQLPAGGTVEQAIAASRILEQFPEIDLIRQKIGIFGTVCKTDKVLADGDRVEIYRPLKQHPMDARRGRLQK